MKVQNFLESFCILYLLYHWSLGNRRCADLLCIITKPSTTKWAYTVSSTLTYTITRHTTGLGGWVVFCHSRWQTLLLLLLLLSSSSSSCVAEDSLLLLGRVTLLRTWWTWFKVAVCWRLLVSKIWQQRVRKCVRELHMLSSVLMYLLPGEFSPLRWPACSLTTVANLATWTLFSFILPALGEWQECDIWCQ